MVIVSSISSTPSRSRFAKIGGTASTTDALTERNSLSATFPLCLGALSGFIGGTASFLWFRFGFSRTSADRTGEVLTLRRMPWLATKLPLAGLATPSSTLRVVSFEVHHGACHVFHMA